MLNIIKVSDDLALSPYHVSTIQTIHKRLVSDDGRTRRAWGVNVIMSDGTAHFREASIDTMESARDLMLTWVETVNRGA
jgi:hypothetical protein